MYGTKVIDYFHLNSVHQNSQQLAKQQNYVKIKGASKSINNKQQKLEQKILHGLSFCKKWPGGF